MTRLNNTSEAQLLQPVHEQRRPNHEDDEQWPENALFSNQPNGILEKVGKALFYQFYPFSIKAVRVVG